MTKEKTTQQKNGVVTLVGRSNVGKSTLLNALIGFKMAPVSPKAQTTRWAVRGVHNEERGQIIFVDTPGLFLHTPDTLTKHVNKQVEMSIKGVDLLLYVVDPTREVGQEEKRLLSLVRSIEKKILVINKIDLPHPQYLYDYEHSDENFLAVVHISAKTGKHLKSLMNEVYAHLPEGEPLYTTTHDSLGDESTFKQWVAEMIREKIYHHIHQEIPYSTHVLVETVEKRGDGLLTITARILTDSKRYKPMIIGKGGKKLKEIGTASRKELELILNKKIFLQLTVDTDPHWLEHFTL